MASLLSSDFSTEARQEFRVDQSVLEKDFVVVTGADTARDFIRLLTIELHWKDKEKTGLPGLPIKGLVKIAK
jgi:hypothetical protein